MFEIDVTNQQSEVPVDEERLRQAVRIVLEGESIDQAQVSLAVVDDPVIRKLNRKYLDEDQATDVLSFVLDHSGGRLEGEVIVSAQTAGSSAGRYGWTPQEELLLYVVHGALHLVDYRDATPVERAEMQNREKAYLAQLGLAARYEESAIAQHDRSIGATRQSGRSLERKSPEERGP